MGSDRAHVDYLVGEMRIVADFEGLQTMGLEVGSGPNLQRGNPRILGHQTDAPVSGFLGYTPGGQCQDFVDFIGPKFEWLAAARQIAQPFDSRLQITFSPLEYRRRRDLQLLADGLGRQSISQ